MLGGPETFTKTGGDKKRSAFQKITEWLLFGRLRKDKRSKGDEKIKDESQMTPFELVEEFQRLGKEKKEKAGEEEKKDIEIIDKNKKLTFRDRLQHAAAETRNLVANKSGTEKFDLEDAYSTAEALISENDLAFKTPFSKSLPEYIVKQDPKLDLKEVSKQVRRAEIKAMYTKIAEGKVNFSIRGEVKDENGSSEIAKKVVIHLDRGDADARIEELRESRQKEIEKAMEQEEAQAKTPEGKQEVQAKKEKLLERVEEEINIIKGVKELRQNFKDSRKTEVDSFVERTVALTESEQDELEYTNLESVIDPETLVGSERRIVNNETVKELQENKALGSALNKPTEEIVTVAKSKYRPIHTQLLEQMVVGFAEKHTAAREFFEDKDDKNKKHEHLSEKLRRLIDSGAGIDETKPVEEKLTAQETKLKEIVSGALGASYNSDDKTEGLKSSDQIVHVPGGVAIVVHDSTRFANLTGLDPAFAKSIKDRKVAGAFLKGEIAKKINADENDFKGDVIIAYADSEIIGEEDQEGRIQNIWEKKTEEEGVRSLLIHEIDHLLQKRQLEGLTGKIDGIRDKLNEGKNEKDKITVDKIIEDLSTKGTASMYFQLIGNDPLLSAVAKGILSYNDALEAYRVSSPKESQNTRDALFEYSSILSQGEVVPENPSLDMLYVKRSENGEIPPEDLKLYKFLLTANEVLTAVKNNSKMTIDERMTVRREIIGIIQVGFHKDVDDLTENLMQMFEGLYLTPTVDEKTGKKVISAIEDKLNMIMQDPAQAKEGEEREKIVQARNDMYTNNDENLKVNSPSENPNIDFSVFPFNPREKSDYAGDANANNAVDFVDAWATTAFGKPFVWARSHQLEQKAKKFEEEAKRLRDEGLIPAAKERDEMARFMRLRKPENRAGEEMSPDANLPLWIAEKIPILGAFIIPGKIEWAKAGLLYGDGGHPLYGRTMKRIPIVGPLMERHFPVLLEKGPWKTVKGYEPDPAKLVSADKNIDSILGGLQVGLDAMGLDRQEMLAVIEALPLFRTVQTSPAMEPQPVFSLSGLDADGEGEKKQIWFDRKKANWVTDFKQEILRETSLDDTKEQQRLDDEIAEKEGLLSEAKRKNPYGKDVLSLTKDIKGLKESKAGKGEIASLKKIYELMEAQKDVPNGQRFTMRHLVEFARKSHEGKFWSKNPDKSRTNYFKVRIPIPGQMGPDGKQAYETFALSDVNLFIKRYTRAYVKEMFEAHKNPDTRKDLFIKDFNARTAEMQLEPIFEQRNKLVEALKGLPADDPKIAEIQNQIDSIDNNPEIQKLVTQSQAGRKYNFLSDEDFGYKKGQFFDIAWGEAESMLDNHKTGMTFYADYQIRTIQAGLIERKTFLAATFYTRLDKILDHFGHWSIIAGLGVMFVTGAPLGFTLVLAGAGMLLADAAFITKAQQVWQARRLKALEAQEKLDNMISLYEQAASGKMLSPDQLEMLGRQKERLTFMVESIMKVDPKDVTKFPADKPLFAIAATGLALFDEYGSNILAGKI